MVTSSFSRAAVAVTLVLLVVACSSVVEARNSIAFRLDDVQCGYLVTQGTAIVNAFIANGVPLTIGIVTGPGTCYTQWLSALVTANPSLLEIASHSSTDVVLTDNSANYATEITATRALLQSQFSGQSVSHFMTPGNVWNTTVAAAIASAGYTSMSEVCTYGSVHPVASSPGPDNMCSTNMYPDVAAPFFVQLADGLYHVPTGASTSSFAANTGVPVNVTTLFTGADSLCTGTEGICSVASQIEKMTGRTANNAPPFSVVMMHPADFSTYTSDQITAYINAMLAMAAPTYQFFTLTHLATGGSGVLIGGSSTGSSMTGGSSTGSASSAGSTSNMMGSSGSSSGTTSMGSSSRSSSSMSMSGSSSSASSSMTGASSSSASSQMSSSAMMMSSSASSMSSMSSSADMGTASSSASMMSSSGSSMMTSSSSGSSMMTTSSSTGSRRSSSGSSIVSAASSSRAIGGVMVAMIVGAMLMLVQ